jgi:sugar/nucleoside kinase (ribokinase family)
MIVTLGETLVCFSPEEPGRLDAARRFRKSVGGAESNTAIGLARLGCRTSWISALGADPFGDEIVRVLRGEGVEVDAVRRTPHAPTGIMIKELRSVDDVRVHYYRKGSAASLLSERDIHSGLIAGASAVHLTGITCALGEGPRKAVHRMLELCNEQRVPVSFDPNLRFKLWTAEEAATEISWILPFVQTVLLSEGELAVCTLTTDLDAGIRKLQDEGVRTVAVRRGRRGAIAEEDGVRVEVDAEPVILVDPVGAGDAFNAGFLFGRDRDYPLDQSAAIGNWAAGQVVAHPGDWEGLPTAEEFNQWIKSERHIDR